ncbi:MAG: FtsQ-type POTRA domain-containing protein [Anaerolineaceae bacterium]
MSATARQPLTHADQVRQRRTQESTERAHRAAETARRTVPATPVYTRAAHASAAAAPRRTQPRTQTRRQVYYSLGTTGAEVRLPAIPAVHLGWRLLSFAIVVVLAVAMSILWSGSLFQVQGVHLVGAQRLTAAEVNDVLNIAGEPAVSIDPAEIKDITLKNFPELAAVSVKVGLPSNLVVTVKERQPIIVWEKGDSDILVDAEGYAFPARGDMPEGLISVKATADPAAAQTETADSAAAAEGASAESAATAVPDASTGKETAEPATGAAPLLTSAMVQSVLTLNAQKPEGSRLQFDPRYGFGWKDPGGWNVYFGLKTDDLAVKLQQYQVISQQLQQKGIKPSMVSVEFIHAPFYRVEQ